MTHTRKVHPSYTRKRFGLTALAALLAGSAVGIGWHLLSPSNIVGGGGSVSVQFSEGVHSFDDVVGGSAIAGPTHPNPSQSTHERGAEVTRTQAGTAFDLVTNGAVADIDPNKSQATQGIDDGSGLTFPCLFDTPGGEVCQRQLTVDEVTARGF